MRYWYGTWDHEDAEYPDWQTYEIDDAMNVVRMIEHFPDGRTLYREAALEGWPSLLDQAFDPEEIDLSNEPAMTLEETTREAFEARWREELKARPLPLSLGDKWTNLA